MGDVLTVKFIRSLQKAYYSPRNIGHCGLASDLYSQVTSPMRRMILKTNTFIVN